MTIALWVAIGFLVVLFFDLNRRATLAMRNIDGDLARLCNAINSLSEKLDYKEEAFHNLIKEKEELIARLWFDAYGMEPAENGSFVPSGRLVQVDGLRPKLRVGDPIFAGDKFYFVE